MTMREIKPGYWKGEIWHLGKRQTIACRGSSAEAKAFEARKRLDIGAKGIVDPRTSPKFASFCVDRYKPHAKAFLRASTWDVRRYQVENLIGFFGTLTLTRINTQLVEEYTHLRAETAKPATVNSELNVLGAILKYAHKLTLPCAAPVIERLPERRKKGRVKAWSVEETQRIYDTCASIAPWFLPMVFFLGQTGCRSSEAVHLPWANVDFDRRLIMIWSECDDDDGPEDAADDGYEVKSREREVPMSDELYDVLRRQHDKWGQSQWVFPSHKGKRKGDQYRCFPKGTVARVLKKAGVKGSPHKFRHTYASQFLQHKPDLYLLSQVLGHSSYRITERLYAHMLPGYLEQARNVVPGVAPKPRPRPAKPKLRLVGS